MTDEINVNSEERTGLTMGISKKTERSTNGGTLVTYTDSFGVAHENCWADIIRFCEVTNISISIQVNLYANLLDYENDAPVIKSLEVNCDVTYPEWDTLFYKGALLSDMLSYIQTKIAAGEYR